MVTYYFVHLPLLQPKCEATKVFNNNSLHPGAITSQPTEIEVSSGFTSLDVGTKYPATCFFEQRALNKLITQCGPASFSVCSSLYSHMSDLCLCLLAVFFFCMSNAGG